MRNLLTIDLEDWFHLLDYEPTQNVNEWASYPSRIEKMSLFLIDFLERHNVKATIFVLGWIAEKYPYIVELFLKTVMKLITLLCTPAFI